MSNEFEKSERDVLRDLGEGLTEIGQKISHRINQFMEDFSTEDGGTSDPRALRADVYETALHFVIEIELPGMQKNQVKISVADNLLVIQGNKQRPDGPAVTRWHSRGRRFGKFQQTFELPSHGLNLEAIKAKFDSGLLTITLAKLQPDEEPNLTEIDIE